MMLLLAEALFVSFTFRKVSHRNTNYDHQFNAAVHEFHLLFVYLEHKIKGILALSLNWKANFKLFNPEMGQV